MRYRNKNIYSWSPEIAYSVGLMASDGCLQSDGRHLDLTSVDTLQLLNFNKSIGKNINISEKTNSSKLTAYRVQFSDVAYYDFLINIGLTPAKSKTMGKLLIPNKYYRDFLRGYFDGDGTVYGYWDRRWRNSFMFYCGFTSASPNFLEWLRITNMQMIGVSLGKIKPNRGADTLTYAKRDSRQIFNYMYYNVDVPKLSRKHLKFVDFLETDPYANKVS